MAGSVSQASKAQEKTMELIGSLTYCGDAQNEGRKQGVHPSVSNHTVSINQPTKQCYATFAVDKV